MEGPGQAGAGGVRVYSSSSSLRYRNATSRVRPCHARLLNLSTGLRACAWHGVRPLRSRSPTTAPSRSFFLDLPAGFIRSREVKKLRGLWGQRHPGKTEVFSFLREVPHGT